MLVCFNSIVAILNSYPGRGANIIFFGMHIADCGFGATRRQVISGRLDYAHNKLSHCLQRFPELPFVTVASVDSVLQISSQFQFSN